MVDHSGGHRRGHRPTDRSHPDILEGLYGSGSVCYMYDVYVRTFKDYTSFWLPKFRTTSILRQYYTINNTLSNIYIPISRWSVLDREPLWDFPESLPLVFYVFFLLLGAHSFVFVFLSGLHKNLSLNFLIENFTSDKFYDWQQMIKFGE